MITFSLNSYHLSSFGESICLICVFYPSRQILFATFGRFFYDIQPELSPNVHTELAIAEEPLP